MKRCSAARHSLLALLLGLLMLPPAQADSGSWVGDAPSVRLFTPGRVAKSAAIAPPGRLPSDARIRRVAWRFEPPVDQPLLEAWLCHRRCLPLSMARGASEALAGLAADQPLYFLFRLPAEAHADTPFRLRGLQVIVDYRSNADLP
ncbi:flagellar protein FlhE [Modicisalibacter ilicicola DSM 19980]|uniref:Flagellar protein FlhE n=1 Tax=Modicisalibacter ilicicola DSM 19980 TaxID=1121942 RepID=A0A1M5CLG0_9GAMM|nr:flagellar protein FlhE [Halomonas ilicicola]SHF55539.1 flagellar protein FlhE [Halomonas ilicicola DSM 19980]